MAKKDEAKNKKRRKKVTRLWLKLLILALFAVISCAVMSVRLLPSLVFSEEGEVAGEDVFYSGNAMTYASQLRTAQTRTEAAAQVAQIYAIDDTVAQELLTQINSDFTSIQRLRDNTILDAASRLTAMQNALPGAYDEEVLDYVLQAPFSEVFGMRQTLRNAVSKVYEDGVRSDESAVARERIAAQLNSSSASDTARRFFTAYMDSFMLPANEHYDALATAAAVEEAMSAVGMVQVTVLNGEKLISKGSVITAEQIEALQALGMSSAAGSQRYTPYAGLLAVTLLLTVLMAYYLAYYQPKLFAQDKAVLLLAVIMLLVLILSKLIAFITFSADNEVAVQIGYLLPVAAASMLLAVLLERNLAIFATMILAVFVGIICDGNAAFALTALGGGLAGVLSTTRLNQRSQFVGASIYIALTNVVLIGAWGLLYNQSYPLIGWGMALGFVNGFLSAILAMGILPFLESAFGVTTVVRLLELSNSNHPLIKRLMVEAPGTYNHSVLVGNLAEAAADAINADTLLVRVASYYHDVGKLKRPYFFIENQGLNDNPHDKLQPALSFMIITSHVREGVEMLREQHFPEEIVALVEQHHGTGLLRPFYQKALDMALDKESVREEDFRYPYTKPQSKEAALVLLADSTQAAVQSLKHADKGAIEELVHNVIQGKMKEGQLKECPLTFQDLQLIEETFLRVLSGMNHSRLLYPDQVAIDAGGNMHEALPDHAAAAARAGLNVAADTSDEAGGPVGY